MAEPKFVIRGISGWVKQSRSVSLTPEEVEESSKGFTTEELSTPEGRLKAFKVAIAEGRVEFAPEERGGLIIQWAAEGVGFGELTIWMNEDGSIEIDDESSSRETLRAILMAVLSQGTTLSEKCKKV